MISRSRAPVLRIPDPSAAAVISVSGWSEYRETQRRWDLVSDFASRLPDCSPEVFDIASGDGVFDGASAPLRRDTFLSAKVSKTMCSAEYRTRQPLLHCWGSFLTPTYRGRAASRLVRIADGASHTTNVQTNEKVMHNVHIT